MLKIIRERMRQGYRTSRYPDEPPYLPERFRGLPTVATGRCPRGCRDCIDACPGGALSRGEERPVFDLGRCLFCTACATACPHKRIVFTTDHRLATRKREDLLLAEHGPELAISLQGEMQRLFGRSLKLRQVSAGGCNACEADVNVLNTLVFDLGRFGIQFVASPRHADGLLVTGPVTRNMQSALLDTWEAIPAPKLVIASGACAISGGPFRDSREVNNGVTDLLPVDLFIPGCPPHPWTTLDGLLRLLGRL